MKGFTNIVWRPPPKRLTGTVIEVATRSTTPEPPSRPAGRPRATNLESIVDAGARLGLNNITLSAVARELEVSVATRYHYVTDRDDLLSRVAGRIIADFDVALDTSLDDTEMLVDYGERVRTFVGAHPGLRDYAVAVMTDDVIEDKHAIVVERLIARGCPADDASIIASETVWFTLSFASAERPLPIGAPGDMLRRRSAAREMTADGLPMQAERDGVFRWALSAYVDGMRAALASGSRPPW